MMLLREVQYCRPGSVQETVSILAENQNARPLAGGQSLLNVMKHRIASPDILVDINSIDELRFLTKASSGSLEIGAMMTYDALSRADEIIEAYPTLARVVGEIADPQVRNRGTIGGNLCFSDPTSNLPPLMVALDATMSLVGPEGRREVPADTFFEGAYKPGLNPGELLISISIPAAKNNSGVGFDILRVNGGGWGLVHASSVVQLSGNEIVDARVVLGCVSDRPVRAVAIESALRGQTASEEALRNATTLDGTDIDPVTDIHASSRYRRSMAGVVARRAVAQAIQEAGGR